MYVLASDDVDGAWAGIEKASPLLILSSGAEGNYAQCVYLN